MAAASFFYEGILPIVLVSATSLDHRLSLCLYVGSTSIPIMLAYNVCNYVVFRGKVVGDVYGE